MKTEEILKDSTVQEKLQMIKKAVDRFESGLNQAVQLRIINRVIKSLERNIKT